MNPIHQQQAQSIETRLRQGTPYRDTYANLILGAFSIKSKLFDERERLSKDPKLSDLGRREALAGTAKRLARELLDTSRLARIGRKHVGEKRAALKEKPAIDRADPVGELRRQEVRAFVRSLPVMERLAAADAFMADPVTADAVLDAPAILSGLPDAHFERLREARRQQLHGPELAELDGLDGDLANVEGAVAVVRRDVQEATGMAEAAFAAFEAPIAAEIDRR